MTKRMLIDATHPEETRVVVVDQDQLVDFDFESSTKTQLKGNVYLAKVTRVEPSLQAAFVEYGGNRHGFLAFSEIHPDYYQIPQADREMLERLEREAIEASRAIENELEPADDEDAAGDTADTADNDDAAASAEDGTDQAASGDGGEDDDSPPPKPEAINEGREQETDEVLGEQVRRRSRLMRSYKIQEVIKRRQIILVQVVKEERGNKGAALTTYLSLAGRYCVLMPNTPRGGGISRKITNVPDRRRLKTIIQDLDVPLGMGLIVRTAGQQRNKSEIKRDYDYLLRQWSEIRDTTLQSVAPARIYQEGDLIKRAMRDLYTRDIDEVLIEGEEGYRSAKKLMQMMMPSHARRVKLYKDDLPLFYRHHVEDQLDGMHSPTVDLPSGGSIVIHTTEALTAIDVNSGRSTRERHIDETAIKTNIEAAEEVARQLRLRDLAGLVVIDFIDMAEHRHQRQVERRFREALKLDRARLQVGRISMFGLLELSRQRLRASLLELSSQACPICSGLGVVRSTESCALHALRCVQEEGIKNEAKVLQLSVPAEVALYLLNQKREALLRLESRYDMKVLVTLDTDLLPSDLHLEVVERRERENDEGEEERERPARPERGGRARRDRGRQRYDRDETESDDKAAPEAAKHVADTDDETSEDSQSSPRKRRRRRRRRRDEDETSTAAHGDADTSPAEERVEQASSNDAGTDGASENTGGEEEVKRRRRRRRRGRGDREASNAASDANESQDDDTEATPVSPPPANAEELLAKLQKFVAIEPRPPRVPARIVDEAAEVLQNADDRTEVAALVDDVVAEIEPAAPETAVAEQPAEAEEPPVDTKSSATGDDSAIAVEEPPSDYAMAVSSERHDDDDTQHGSDVERSSDDQGDDTQERRGWWSRWVK